MTGADWLLGFKSSKKDIVSHEWRLDEAGAAKVVNWGDSGRRKDVADMSGISESSHAIAVGGSCGKREML
jgi:hypothetical protein